MRPTLAILAAALLLTPVSAPAAGATNPESVLEPVRAEGENLLRPDAWRPYRQGFTREGPAIVCNNGADAKVHRGASQTVTLNQKEPRPIVATCWSRADGVAGRPDANYSLYLDLVYTDGRPLWGQTHAFATGSHNWGAGQVVRGPAKPVRSVTVNLLLRGHAGKALFKDPKLVEVTTPQGAVMFDGTAMRVTGTIERGWLVRDAAAGDGGVVALEPAGPGRFRALGLDLDVAMAFTGVPKRHIVQATLRDTTGRDRAVTLYYVIPVPAEGLRWLTPRSEVACRPSEEYADLTRVPDVGARELMSRWPLAAVAGGGAETSAGGGQGAAVAIDMSRPAFYRLGCSAGAGILYAAFDLGLAPEKPTAEVRLVEFSFDAAWGFRGALAELYAIFPSQFASRTPEMGLWMPFHKTSTVRGWQDFGFRFKEGNNETAWDDAHGLITFRYTEPMTWWMPMPKDMPRTYEAALAHARQLAEKGDPRARALLASGFHDADGRFPCRLRDTPWCNGAAWSMNSMPGAAGEVTDFSTKWNDRVADPYYGPKRKGDLDGEYVDSSEGYMTDALDFRRDHFQAAQTPLVFAAGTHRPAIFRGLVVFEYVRALEAEMRRRGKLMMANGTPWRIPWLCPMLDVMGTETNWNRDNRWSPLSVDELLYKRALAGKKPYCFLQNTRFEDFGPDKVERYMRRCLAFGMFPGFFSPDASGGHYFSRPELYDRDRPLFTKYVPLIRLAAETGWEPVPLVRCDERNVTVERWGDRYLTVFNAGNAACTVTLTDAGLSDLVRRAAGRPLGTVRDLVHGRDIAWRDGRATLSLEPEDVALLDLAPAAARNSR